VPSSLEDAVMREISDRSPAPGGAHVPTSNPPPIVEPSALRKRSSNPPAVDDGWDDLDEPAPPLPSIPPDAVVPETAPPAPEPQHDTEMEAPYSSPFAPTDDPPPAAQPTPPPTRAIEPTVPLPRPTRPAPAPAEEPPVPRRSAWPFVAAFAGLGVAVGLVVATRSETTTQAITTTATTASVLAATSIAPPVPTPSAAPTPPASAQGDELPPGAEVPPGLGLVEVTAPTGARVRIDGAIGGAGPVASLVAAPGYHEVRVEQDGSESKQVIEVRAGKTTRVKSGP
jgi:hypothetical protein